MWLWLRRRFLTGFFVTVPLFISVAALVWMFGIVDGLTTPFYDRVLGQRIPGLGTLTTAVGHSAGGRRGHQRHRQAPAAAGGEPAAARAGVSHDLRPGAGSW